MAEGCDEDTATEKAILQMGDPVLIGGQLDRTHRPKVEWSIVIITALALVFRIIIHIAAFKELPVRGPGLFENLISIFIGIGALVIAYYIDFIVIGKYPKVVFLGFILVTTVYMFISPVISGRIAYGPYLLLLFPTVFAGIVYHVRSKGYLGISLCILCLLVPIPFGLFIPSFTSIGLNMLICLMLITLAIAKNWFKVNKFIAILLVYVITIFVSLLIFVANKVHISDKILGVLNPYIEPQRTGYMSLVIRDVLRGSQFFGQGTLTVNLPIGRYLPEIYSDSLLAYLVYKFGWIAAFLILVFSLIFVYHIFSLCSKQKSILGSLVATSVFLTFTVQVIFFFIFNLGIPVFSMVLLPIIAPDRAATIVNMLLIGLMLSVFKSGDYVQDKLILTQKNLGSQGLTSPGP